MPNIHVQEKKHARLGGSSADRWAVCFGSVRLESYFPNTSSKYADWGTAAHELADMCLQDGSNAEDHIGQSFTVNGRVFEVDMEMADCVNDYLADVYSLIDPDAGDSLYPEEQVAIDHITGEEGAEGTSDAVGISADGKILTVADLKTGRGVQVYAYSHVDPDKERPAEFHPDFCQPNRQLLTYASGSLRKHAEACTQIETIRLAISQPRLNWLDVVDIPIEEFHRYIDELSVAAGMAMIDDGQTLVPGEKQCKFCRASATCPAYTSAVLKTVGAAKAATSTSDVFAGIDGQTLSKKVAAVAETPDDAEQLAQAYRSLTLIENWIKAVRAETERRLFDGQDIPGVKLVPGKKGNRVWRDPSTALSELTKSGRLKKSEAIDEKVISPTAAEKVLKDRPKIWAKIAPLIHQAEGKPSIARADDPRPRYEIASTVDTFSELDTGGVGDLSPELAQALL